MSSYGFRYMRKNLLKTIIGQFFHNMQLFLYKAWFICFFFIRHSIMSDFECLKAFQDGQKEEAVRLLSLAVDLHNLTDSTGRTVLHLACYHGWTEVVMKLVNDYRFDPTCTDMAGNTPLHTACKHGDMKLVRYLISECRCDLMFKNNKGNTPLHIGCRYGDIEMVRYLSSECEPMSMNNKGNTPLHKACKYRDIQMVQFLVDECKCDSMCANNVGNTPLHMACFQKGNLNIIQYLISKHHCDPKSKSRVGSTPLHEACRYGDIQMVKYLIEECHCDPKSKKYDGSTPLHGACREGDIQMVTYLIKECYCDPTSKNNEGSAPLHEACRHGDIQMVKYLIEECHCDPKSKGSFGSTPVHEACREGDIQMVKYLIEECHCDPKSKNNEGSTPLHEACKNGDIQTVKYLIEECHCDSKSKGSFSSTPLHEACRYGDIQMVKYLIEECHCDPKSKKNDGSSPLHGACRRGDIQMVKYLIKECHCDPNSMNNEGSTLLHEACRYGDIQLIKYLIEECHCDPKSINSRCSTPLHGACRKGDIQMVKYLIKECHCDPNSMNNEGSTLLHEAFRKGDIQMVKCLVKECHCDPKSINSRCSTFLHEAFRKGDIQMVKCLVDECHCDPNSMNNEGSTLLHEACRKGDIQMVKCLVKECHCDLKSKKNDGSTPLHEACRKGNIQMVKYLIKECHCDPKSKKNDGSTPLHEACRYGDVLIVKYLIKECHCDPNSMNNEGSTLLHEACRKGDIQMVKCLVKECHCDPKNKKNDGSIPLHEACRNGDILMVKYLIKECHCDPMSRDRNGNTPLHYLCKYSNCIPTIEYFLSTGKIDPLCRNDSGDTPLKLLDGETRKKVNNVFAKFGKIRISHPVNSYANIVVLGNPGAGKSTLAQVIIQRASGVFASIRGLFRYVKGVKLCTAGIIPSKLEHRELGNVILHDLAGQPEYYSSHIAVLENLLHSSAAVFVIVVNLAEKEVYNQLHHWLTIVENECKKALDQCHVVTVVSHIDEVNQRNLPNIYRELAEISSSRLSQQSIVNCGLVYLDCRKLVGGEFSSFTTTLSSACQSIRNTNTRETSLYCHMLYALLEEKEESVYTLDQLMAILRKSEEYCLPQDVEEISELLSSLHTTGLIVFLKNNHTPGNSWIVARKGVLLTEVNGVLFAPDNFKEHRDIASNTGIISVSSLSQLFPQYSTEMLVLFLQYMELCQEISQDFLTCSNMKVKDKDLSHVLTERLLFFPALVRETERPDKISGTFRFGWCLRCSYPYQFFIPRFLHVLLLHLAYQYTIPSAESQLHRRCTIWTSGIWWKDTRGVQSLVELVDNSQCVLLLMSCCEGSEENMLHLCKQLISEILTVRHQLCPTLKLQEFIIDPSCLRYPIPKPSTLTLYDIELLVSCIRGRELCVLDTKGDEQMKISDLFPFDPYQSHTLSIFAECNPEVSDSITI